MSLDESTPPRTVPAAAQTAEPDAWRLLVGPRLLVVAVVLWAWSLIDVDLRAMSDLGLLSVLPPTYFLALALLTVGFLFVLDRSIPARRLLGGYVLALVVMIHATPALLSDAARYSTSYPRLGAIDQIIRTGDIDPTGSTLAIHAGWPGSFGFTALLAELTGFAPMTIAMWMPTAVVLVSLLALVHIYRGFTSDPRVVWLGVWLVVLGNWVGHELFGPLGFASALYLSLLAVAVAHERQDRGNPVGRVRVGSAELASVGRQRVMVATTMLLLGVAVSASDPFTVIVLVAALVVVARTRVARTEWVAVAVAATAIFWLSISALELVSDGAFAEANAARLRTETSTTSPLDLGVVGVSHETAVVFDRFLVEAMIVLALVGFVVLSRRRSAWSIAWLALSPLVLLIMRLDLDAIFRVYGFALPWLAFAAASGLVALTDRRDIVASLGVRAVVLAVLLIAFLFAHFGREGVVQFTAQELALTDWISDHAPAETLVVVGSSNHTVGSRSVEDLTVVPIAAAAGPNLATIDEDPEAGLHQLLSDARFTESYVLLTRSMFNEQRDVPTAPPGTFERIAAALRASDRFTIVQSNVDGTVWSLADGEP